MVELREKTLSNGKKSLYLDIFYEKNRHYKFLKIYLDGSDDDKTKLKIAEKEKRKIELELLQGTYSYYALENSSFYNFYEQHKKNFFRVNEKDNLIRHMKNVRKELTIKQIDNAFWFQLKKYFESKNHQPFTIFTAQKNLLTILNYAVRNGYLLKHNLNIKEKRPASTRVYLTFDEVKKILATDCRNEIVKNAFLFACFTGLRIGDLRKLKYDNIIDGQVEIVQEKTKQNLYMPLNESAKLFIPKNNTTDPNRLVFGGLPRSSVHSIMREWIAKSGISKHVVFHSSRHTFATLAVNANIPIAVLKDLMGHTEIETTMIYAKILDQSRKDAINSLPSLINNIEGK